MLTPLLSKYSMLFEMSCKLLSIADRHLCASPERPNENPIVKPSSSLNISLKAFERIMNSVQWDCT